MHDFTFTGENISVIYRGYPNVFGNMEVRIDGSVVATINQNTTTQSLQKRWSSGNLGAGYAHSDPYTPDRDLCHTGWDHRQRSTYCNTHCQQYFYSNQYTYTHPNHDPPPPVGYGTYDERSAEIVYTGSWVAQSISGNYANTEKYSRVIGSNARFTFTGENISCHLPRIPE